MMEKTDTYAILDINICNKDSEKTDNDDIVKSMPLTTVIKIRKFIMII